MQIKPTSDPSSVSVASRPGRKTLIVAVLFGFAVAAITFGRDLAAYFGMM